VPTGLVEPGAAGSPDIQLGCGPRPGILVIALDGFLLDPPTLRSAHHDIPVLDVEDGTARDRKKGFGTDDDLVVRDVFYLVVDQHVLIGVGQDVPEVTHDFIATIQRGQTAWGLHLLIAIVDDRVVGEHLVDCGPVPVVDQVAITDDDVLDRKYVVRAPRDTGAGRT
jgi:hypothetical protein